MKFICLLLFLSSASLSDALKCYSGGFYYDVDSGTREGEAELVECSSHHDACVIVGKKNMPSDFRGPFTVYEQQCGFSTAGRLLIGRTRRETDFPDIYKQNLLDKCIYTDTGTNTSGIICFCNTDRCNDIANYHQPQTCYRTSPNPNQALQSLMLRGFDVSTGNTGFNTTFLRQPGDRFIRFDGDFGPPPEVACGLGGCAEFTAFAKYETTINGDIEVSNDIEARRDAGYLSVQVCCCEDELCNRKGKNWSTTSSSSSSDSDEDLLWWFR